MSYDTIKRERFASGTLSVRNRAFADVANAYTPTALRVFGIRVSWDVVQNLPTAATCVADIPDDCRPQPIRQRATMIAEIHAEFLRADLTDPTWGTSEAGNYSIDFNFGVDAHVRSFAMHVRSAVDVVDTVAIVLARLDLHALDISSGGFFSVETATQSMEAWSRYRNEALSDDV